MASPSTDCDCPAQTLWTFPAPGSSDLLPPYPPPQSSSFKIEEFLDTSAQHPPTSGFGTIAPYLNDVVQIEWPSDYEVPAASYRNLYCKPCTQKVENNRTHEEFDWASCGKQDGFGGIWSTSIDTNRGYPTIALLYPKYGDSETMLCTLGFPGTLPGGLSQAFPFINKKPPPGRGRHIFTLDAPEGKPYDEDRSNSSGIYYKIGAALLLAFCVVLLGHLFWLKRKQRKASRALKAELEEARMKQACQIGQYSDDV